jgi:hypothetical protein
VSAVADMAEALEAALETITADQTYRDPGANIVLPATVLGPPALIWEGMCDGPTSARFLVYAIAAANEEAPETLPDFAIVVAAAIDAVPNAVVTRADPAVYVTGTTQLPCYQLTIECSL